MPYKDKAEKNAQQKVYNEAHKEERKAYGVAYHEAHKEERAAYREANKEEIATQKKAYFEAHREERNAQKKAYRATDAGFYIRYISTVKSKYGLTEMSLRDRMDEQKGCCSICRRSLDHDGKTFHVDHCHTTGLTRGLLCCKCNHLLGHADDSVDTLYRSIFYLTHWSKEHEEIQE